MTRSPAESSRALHELIASGAPDDAVVHALTPFVTTGESVERLITRILRDDRGLDAETRERTSARWYRRAVDAGHLWALHEAGTRWCASGSGASIDRDRIERSSDRIEEPSDDDTVTAEEARRWLIRAAELGHRRACLDAARTFEDDSRVTEWLWVFCGDSESASVSDRVERAEAALMLARKLVGADDPEAGQWFRRAAECPPWTGSDAMGLSSWVQAASDCALWAHGQTNQELCSAWAYRVIENAANCGPVDRVFLATEWKTCRSDWQTTARDEAARSRIMCHLLTEHDLPGWQMEEVSLLLTNTWDFGHSHLEQVRAVFGDHAHRSFTLDELLPPVRTGGARSIDVPIDSGHAWAVIRWLLADAVPAAFRFVGADAEAAEFASLVPDDITEVGEWQWSDSVDRFEGWQRLDSSGGDSGAHSWELARAESASFEKTADAWVKELLDRVGLGAGPNRYRTIGAPPDEDWLSSDPHEARWRLLRGRSAWLGMCLAVADGGEADEWISCWDDVSRLVVHSFRCALKRLGHDLGISWSTQAEIPRELDRRWRLLGDACEWSYSEFVHRMASGS